MLAVCVLREQGCAVEGIAFESPFFAAAAARRSAAALALPLRVADFTADIIALIRHPPHGFGGALNPCIDCHARMVRRAGELMTELGWDFVATGEVLDQRPMSQNRKALETVARESGFAEHLVRPLSALLLAPTRPEREGLLERSRLLGLQGRSRRPQAGLAARHGIREYPSPAGGCLLTEKLFCAKLRDLKEHEGLENLRDVRRLRLGRHFRLPGGAKCIVGRNAAENARLRQEAGADELILRPANMPGPTAVLPASAAEADRRLAAAICAGYCDNPGTGVRLRHAVGGAEQEELVAPLPREAARQWLL